MEGRRLPNGRDARIFVPELEYQLKHKRSVIVKSKSKISHNQKHGISRRDFMAAAAALTVVSSGVLGRSGNVPPSNKLNIAGIGVGGVGSAYLQGLGSENIVALCDVDEK